MPIRVTCPNCHTRFSVGDQHAGKTGACPKCKGSITVPKPTDEVIIHAPELEAGAKDARGKSVLKPIARKEAKFRPNVAAAIGGAVLLCLALAFLLGRNRADLGDSLAWIMGAAALAVGPPLAYAGYAFLRDDELASFQGRELVVRCLACGAVYALLWGVYSWVAYQLWGLEIGSAERLEMVQIAGLVVPLLGVGAFAAFVSFDLEPLTGLFHYALYLLATIVLRIAMQLPLLPGMGSG
jgi:predicted Zn finger-like uncharacterized protein